MLTLYSAKAIIVPLPHGIIWNFYPPRPLLAVPNVTAHPSTDSVPINVI